MWILRPKEITGPKLKTWWTGPFRIISQSGENSFSVGAGSDTRDVIDVHVDQMKLYKWDDKGPSFTPLFYRRQDPLL